MSKSTRTRGLEDVKAPVGRAVGEVIVTTQLGEIMRDYERKRGTGGTARLDLEEKRAEALEKKYDAKKLGYELEAKKTEKELEKIDQLGVGGQQAMIFFPVREKGKILIKRLKLNPGEVEVVGEVPEEREKKGEKKGEVTMTGDSLVKLITEGKGGGVTLSDISKYVDAKIEAQVAKVGTKLTELSGKIDQIIEGKGKTSVKDQLSIVTELKDLGLIKVKGEKKEGGEGLSGLAKTIKTLEDAGLVVRATKVNQEAAKLEFDKEKEGMSFWLAARKLVADEKKALMEERTSREKIKMFKDFAKDIGKAVAEGLEESEEEAEETEEEEVEGKEERVIEESEKSPAGIETFACDAVIDGVKCGAPVSIPPEAQKKGYRLTCAKCGSQYEYLPPTEEKTK